MVHRRVNAAWPRVRVLAWSLARRSGVWRSKDLVTSGQGNVRVCVMVCGLRREMEEDVDVLV